MLTWCSHEQLAIIQRAAESTGVEVEGVASLGILIFTHHNVERMLAFARELVTLE